MKFIILAVMTCSLLVCESITDLDFTRINEHYYEKYMSSEECHQFPSSCFFALSAKESLEFLYEMALHNEASAYVAGIQQILDPEIGKSITFADLTSLLVDSNYNVEFRFALLELTLEFKYKLDASPSDLISLLDEIASNPKNDKKFASYAINRMGKLSNGAVLPELIVKYENLALDANTFEEIRIQSILFLESNDQRKLNDILRAILRDENTTDPEVIGQALLTLSDHSSDENDINLIDEIVMSADDEIIFDKGITALGDFCTKETIAKIMSHRNHRLATARNISYGLTRCYSTVLSIAEEANTIEEKSYAIDCLESLGSPDAYYLLKGMRTNRDDPREIKDKLDSAIDILEVKYGKETVRKKRGGN